MRLSVRLSVTLRYCLKTRERRRVRSLPSGRSVSSFLVPRMLDGDDPVQVKFECKEVDHPVKTAELYTFRLNSGTVILVDSERRSINVNRKATMDFPTSYQPRSWVTPNFPKMGFSYPHLSFLQKFRPKTIKSLLQSFTI